MAPKLSMIYGDRTVVNGLVTLQVYLQSLW